MIFLTYLWNGWTIEFAQDSIYFTNPLNKNKWQFHFNPYDDVPFILRLVEKG